LAAGEQIWPQIVVANFLTKAYGTTFLSFSSGWTVPLKGLTRELDIGLNKRRAWFLIFFVVPPNSQSHLHIFLPVTESLRWLNSVSCAILLYPTQPTQLALTARNTLFAL
jgi:hypothetical protein